MLNKFRSPIKLIFPLEQQCEIVFIKEVGLNLIGNPQLTNQLWRLFRNRFGRIFEQFINSCFDGSDGEEYRRHNIRRYILKEIPCFLIGELSLKFSRRFRELGCSNDVPSADV